MKAVVLGVGNLLLGDEGVGVHAVRRLAREPLPPEVTVVDGGTRGLALFPFLRDATHLLVVDAVRLPHPPGTVVELEGEVLLRGPSLKLSAHDVALPDLLNLLVLRRSRPFAALRLVGVVPATMEVGMTLSPPVARAIPVVLTRIRGVLIRWGVCPVQEVDDVSGCSRAGGGNLA